MRGGRQPSFYSSPSFRGRRAFNLDLDDSIFDPVFAYAEATMPERPIQDAVRELLIQATATDARDGAIRGAKMQAYREMQQFLYREVGAFLQEITQKYAIRVVGDSANVAGSANGREAPQAHAVGEPA